MVIYYAKDHPVLFSIPNFVQYYWNLAHPVPQRDLKRFDLVWDVAYHDLQRSFAS